MLPRKKSTEKLYQHVLVVWNVFGKYGLHWSLAILLCLVWANGQSVLKFPVTHNFQFTILGWIIALLCYEANVSSTAHVGAGTTGPWKPHVVLHEFRADMDEAHTLVSLKRSRIT